LSHPSCQVGSDLRALGLLALHDRRNAEIAHNLEIGATIFVARRIHSQTIVPSVSLEDRLTAPLAWLGETLCALAS
jgi:hypothetical protein